MCDHCEAMAYPVLFHDDERGEPACTGCMACVNYCPVECISATVARNPRNADGSSHRKTVADSFTIDLSQCIECGICVDVCDWEAIGLGYFGSPPPQPVGIRWLEAQGRRYEDEVGAEAAHARPDVVKLLKSVQDRLPPASAGDGARRAWSRLKRNVPVDLKIPKEK